MSNTISEMVDTAMKNIRTMVDSNTIVGEPISVPDGTIIVPVSTLSFGFGAGGTDISNTKNEAQNGSSGDKNVVFGGGTGGGAKIKPVAFLVVGNGSIRILPISNTMTPMDKIIDLVPEMVDKVNGFAKDFMSSRQEKAAQSNAEESAPEVEPFEN